MATLLIPFDASWVAWIFGGLVLAGAALLYVVFPVLLFVLALVEKAHLRPLVPAGPRAIDCCRRMIY